jgi:hypothetical protein
VLVLEASVRTTFIKPVETRLTPSIIPVTHRPVAGYWKGTELPSSRARFVTFWHAISFAFCSNRHQAESLCASWRCLCPALASPVVPPSVHPGPMMSSRYPPTTDPYSTGKWRHDVLAGHPDVFDAVPTPITGRPNAARHRWWRNGFDHGSGRA